MKLIIGGVKNYIKKWHKKGTIVEFSFVHEPEGPEDVGGEVKKNIRVKVNTEDNRLLQKTDLLCYLKSPALMIKPVKLTFYMWLVWCVEQRDKKKSEQIDGQMGINRAALSGHGRERTAERFTFLLRLLIYQHVNL